MQELAFKDGFAKILSKEALDVQDIRTLFSNVKVQEINFYKKSKKMEVKIISDRLIPAQTIAEIEERFAGYFCLDCVDIRIKYKIDEEFEELLYSYWDDVVFCVGRKLATSRGLLSGCDWSLLGNKLTVHLKTKGANILNAQRCGEYIEDIIEDFFSKKVRVEFIDCVIDENYNNKYVEEKKAQEEKILKNVIYMAGNSEKRKKKSQESEKESENNVILGKDFKDEILKMKDVNQDSGKIAIKGEILNVDSREIRGEKYLFIFDITDKTNSFTVKFFIKKEKYEEIKDRIKPGITVKVRGETVYDKFAGEVIIMATDIVKRENQNQRIDAAPEKRIELHLHTQMSSMDGVTPVEELVKRAAEWGHKAIAVTDHGVVQAYPGASEASSKYKIKIIYGVECYLVDDTKDKNFDYTKAKSYHAIILVKNTTGLKNLYKLISQSHLNYFYKRPRMTKSMIMEHREGLILGTACEAGELYTAFLNNADEDEIIRIASFYDYLEIQPLDNNQFLVNEGKVESREALIEINKKIVELGERINKPVVATCDVHFMDPEDEIFRRILMAGQGYDDADKQAPLYFRTTDEMLEEFSYLGTQKAYEVVVINPNKINDMVEEIAPIPEGTFPPKIEGAEDEIKNISLQQAKELYGDPLPQIVEERLWKELDSIIKNGFSVMYLIAMKLVKKSLSDGYLVGSRGSVGSSFVAYLTGITEVNPLQAHYLCRKCKYSEFITDGSVDCGLDLEDKNCPVCGEKLGKGGYDIPFETFLGFNGDKEPDIDLNFSGEYQPVAHKYVEELFGEGHVFRAGTIASVAEKTAYGFVKKYLDERSIITTNAELNRLIKGCTGVKRTTGQHPGGVMIIPQDKEIYDFTPIQYPADDVDARNITTHFDYNFLHGSILKLDILGHDDPTTIKMLENLTGVNAREIPLDDKDTMEIFSSTKSLGVTPEEINSEVGTIGIPEFGTKFVRQMLVETRPKTMSELIKISGLSHGTDVWLNNAQDLIRSNIATLSEVICTRDDIMLYLLHSGLPPITAFKIMEDVRKGKGLKPEYVEIMRSNNVPEWYIESCKKIKYMFPKAHAAAYVMMAFRIAWFKVHYPLEFYATYLTVKADEFDADIMTQSHEKIREKIKEMEETGNNLSQKDKNVLTILEVINEMYARGIRFLKTDLYKSDAKIFLIENGSIRPPLNGLPGLGIAAAQSIVEERKKRKFSSVEDLRLRTKVGKNVIDILRQHKCLEGLPESDQISLF